MQTVAEIAATGRDPGLVALLCTYCAATDSALTYPTNRAREVGRSNIIASSGSPSAFMTAL